MTDRSAIGKRSKRKGKTYERRVSKLLLELTEASFRSTPGSGGFNKFGGVKIREELFCGDVICDDSAFAFCVEAKNRKSFSFTAILKNPETAAFTQWWHQCVGDAVETNLLPIMFFKPDNQADFIVLSKEGMDKLAAWDLEYFELKLYDRELTFKTKDSKTREAETITAKLPVPYVLNWKVVHKSVLGELFFRR